MNKAWIPTSIRHYSCHMSLLETACGRLTIQRYKMQPANGDLRSCQHDCHAMTQPKDLSVATAEPERKVVIWLIDSSPSAVLSCTPAHAGNSQAGDKPMGGGACHGCPGALSIRTGAGILVPLRARAAAAEKARAQAQQAEDEGRQRCPALVQHTVGHVREAGDAVVVGR